MLSAQSDHHRVADVRQEADVEDLRDDLHAAPSVCIAFRQIRIELKNVEALVERLAKLSGCALHRFHYGGISGPLCVS